MERSERLRLESIRRRLSQDLAAIDELLKIAKQPTRRSGAEVRERALGVCRDVQQASGKHGEVTTERLRDIVTTHGMPFTAVGALYVAGYLRKTSDGDTVLEKRGLAVVGKKRTKGRKKK